MSVQTATPDEKEELLLSCRYGDIDDVQNYLERFGVASFVDVRDDNANTPLHMAAANGHADILELLLPHSPSSLISAANNAGSTPLHWAALNKQLSAAQALVRHPSGPGAALVDIKNKAGHTPLGEAENSEWDEGARWFVEVMDLGTEEGTAQDTAEDADEEGKGLQDVEVEITDAEGGVAKMTLGKPGLPEGKET